MHAAVDTLGHLLALHVTAADEQDREQVETLAEAVQQITGESIDLAYVDQGYAGENAAQAAAQHGIQLEVAKHTKAKRGFMLLPRRWVVERSFAWAVRFRRLARDYERLANILAALHYLAFACRTVVDLPPFSHPFITRDSVCVTRPGKLSQNQLETSAYVVRLVPVWRARLQLM